MNINYLAVLLATVLQFVAGAVWYSVLFGKLWGKIHGFDKLSKEAQQKMMKSMGPMYAVQFLTTLLTSYVIGLFLVSLPSPWHAFGATGFFWLGFVLPTVIGAVIWGGTEPRWIVKKIAVQAGALLVCYQIAAVVFYFVR